MQANLQVQLRLRDEAKGSTYHQLKFHYPHPYLGSLFRSSLSQVIEWGFSPFHERLRCFFMWPHKALNLSYRTLQRGHSYRRTFKSGMWALALTMAPPATLCLMVFSVFGKVDALWPALIGPGLCCVWSGGNWKSVGFSMVVFLCSNMVTWKSVKGNARGFWGGVAVFITHNPQMRGRVTRRKSSQTTPNHAFCLRVTRRKSSQTPKAWFGVQRMLDV